MKLLTLAIASYNMEEFLDKCMESVTGPDIPDTLEIIVVNDGSKDRTKNIAHVYETIYPNIVKVIDKSNGHYGSCINTALENASGKYFRPLDADDWVNTENLITLLRKLETCQADLIITEFSIYKTSGIEHNTIPDIIEVDKIYDAKKFDVEDTVTTGLFAMHGMTYKTEKLRAIDLKLHTGIHYTDTEYILLPIDRIDSLVFFKLNLYQYNMMREGQSIQKSIQHLAIDSFYILSSSLIKYYIEHCTINNEIVKSNQRCILRRVLYYFFVSSLVFGDMNNDKNKKMVNDIYSLIEKNEELKNDSFEFRYKGIEFVKIWFRYHIRIFALVPKSIL